VVAVAALIRFGSIGLQVDRPTGAGCGLTDPNFLTMASNISLRSWSGVFDLALQRSRCGIICRVHGR